MGANMNFYYPVPLKDYSSVKKEAHPTKPYVVTTYDIPYYPVPLGVSIIKNIDKIQSLKDLQDIVDKLKEYDGKDLPNLILWR
jgi:hypothetical protein